MAEKTRDDQASRTMRMSSEDWEMMRVVAEKDGRTRTQQTIMLYKQRKAEQEAEE